MKSSVLRLTRIKHTLAALAITLFFVGCDSVAQTGYANPSPVEQQFDLGNGTARVYDAEGNYQTVKSDCGDHCGSTVETHSVEAYTPAVTPPVRSTGIYGAIAYDKKSGAWGLADASPDKEGTRQSALGYCSPHGPHCEVVGNFSSTCVAVASGNDNVVTWASDANLADAQTKARKACVKKTQDSCTVRLSHCYTL